MVLSALQLTGRDERALVEVAPGQRLLPAVADNFMRLQADAREAGFELAVASAYRSFERQRLIWNGKACGERPVHDDCGEPLDTTQLSAAQCLHAIMRFSALPGASRHHWGTDLDVYDAAAMPTGYQLQLSPAEVAPGGLFDPLHRWLDARMAQGHSYGFYRPYAQDCGGVAPERWHLSYAPLARACERAFTVEVLRQCWAQSELGAELALADEVLAELESLYMRYVRVAADWCPPLGADTE